MLFLSLTSEVSMYYIDRAEATAAIDRYHLARGILEHTFFSPHTTTVKIRVTACCGAVGRRSHVFYRTTGTYFRLRRLFFCVRLERQVQRNILESGSGSYRAGVRAEL